jgi:hypothetical protein
MGDDQSVGSGIENAAIQFFFLIRVLLTLEHQMHFPSNLPVRLMLLILLQEISVVPLSVTHLP